MARQPEEVAELRRALGAALATYLDASPLNQSDLARKANYDRSSISHITYGRQFPERGFWVTADDTLGANGALVAQYDDVCDQENRLKRAELDREQAERNARIREMTQGVQRASSDVDSYPAAAQICAESAPIDGEYIESLHHEIKKFVHLDQQYGGVAASPVILQAYKQMRHRINTSEIRKGLRRDTYSTLSEVAEVAGWSLYDSGDDALTERVNNESLTLARLAGDRSMELFVLQNMAMHAEAMRQPRRSINLCQLVLETDALSPRLEALFRLRLARSYGQLQARNESRSELARARSLFQDGVRDTDPHWAWWVNEAQLWWVEGAVRVNLGMAAESVAFFERAANYPSEPRMNFVRRSTELFGYCVNASWVHAEQSLRGIMKDAGICSSRIAEVRLKAAVDLIDGGKPPGTVRDLGAALRARLSITAQRL